MDSSLIRGSSLSFALLITISWGNPSGIFVHVYVVQVEESQNPS
jgi:hypothetical protein